LIIFFMTVSAMSAANQTPVELPKQTGAENTQPKTFVINVLASGEIVLEGETVTVGGLVSKISSELPKVGDNPEKIHIVLRGDERVDSRAVNEIVKALGRLRITHIRIAVESRG
jgi:biopolymer transport protein ExbD